MPPTFIVLSHEALEEKRNLKNLLLKVLFEKFPYRAIADDVRFDGSFVRSSREYTKPRNFRRLMKLHKLKSNERQRQKI